MARRLLLLTDDIFDDAMEMAEALKARGYEASPYRYLTDSAKDLVQETPVVLLLTESDSLGFIAKAMENLERTFPEVRFVTVLLPEGTRQIANNSIAVHLSDFSPSEIRKVVETIESNLARAAEARHQQPSFAIAWDPSAVEPEEYADLVSAIADVARATGAAGIRRLQEQYLLRSVEAEAET